MIYVEPEPEEEENQVELGKEEEEEEKKKSAVRFYCDDVFFVRCRWSFRDEK